MPPLDLLSACPPSLSHQLKSRIDHGLATILRANHNTRFVQVASELAAFRETMAGRVDDVDDATLCDTFRRTVQLTTYDAYAPLISSFFEKPCRENDVANLLVPGLPDYIVRSSSTSGGAPKAFPKYNRLTDPSANVALPDSVPKRTTACIFSFAHDSLDITDENDQLVKTIIITFTISSIAWRTSLGLHPDRDQEKMATFLSDFAAPHAAYFVKKWRSFLIIHGLFALGSKALEAMHMSFVTTFVELIRYIDAEYDMVIDCIGNGTIPDIDGIAEVRHHLESTISPDPERAAELRGIGRPSSRSRWCSLVWPNLGVVACTASGPFASSLQLARSFLSQNVKIRSRIYGGTEGRVGSAYNPLDLEHYKVNTDIAIEFLDFSKSESMDSVTQPWDAEHGKRYEIVMTTVHGLWRYRLGDVVEIAGFDPTDGTPVIRFIERRNVAIRFAHFMVSEKELRSAMSFVTQSVLGNVVDWTATVDERRVPPTIGFFVELAAGEASDPLVAGERILDELSHTNKMISHSFAKGSLGKPTIRIVERGTFSAFRQLKLDEGGDNLGQVKVPIVLPKPIYVTWFSRRVVKEL